MQNSKNQGILVNIKKVMRAFLGGAEVGEKGSKASRLKSAQRLIKTKPDLLKSGVLKSKSEMDEYSGFVKQIGIPPHHDHQKNWDTLKALGHVLNVSNISDPVLDAGSGAKPAILNWLYHLGYENLHACDRIDKNPEFFKQRNIKFQVIDMSALNYPAEYFSSVISVSVIEHGVELEAFYREMGRILKKGGRLVVSTDYWQDKIDCTGKYPYGEQYGEMKVFTASEMKQQIQMAEKYGLRLIDKDIDFSCQEKCVLWERMQVRYTFIFLAFEKK